jgi:glycosyltransferase involved in cell wall biosynthesis
MGLRFCHVTTFYPPHNFGGDGILVQRLCRGLARRGHEVTVICDVDAYNALHHGAEPPAGQETDGVNVIRLKSAVGALSPLLTQQFGRPVLHRAQIAAFLDSGRFDVINFHNVSLVGGPGLFRMGRAVKLYMAHEHWLVCPSHVLWRHDREPCSSRECLRCVFAYRRPPQVWRYTGAIEREGRHIDAFIAMSEFSRAKHREFGFPYEMEVLPCFLPDVEPAPSAVAPRAAPQTRPYFLFVGRLERIKGVDTILPLFNDYADADLLIAGDGEQCGALRALAADCPRIKFLGRVTMPALADYYRHAIALIVPSIGFETFGIVLIEAFRNRTPAIARRIGPFPEIVERAQAGELFSTPGELLAAMRRLQQDASRRAALAENGYQAYRRYWCESAVVPQYLEIVRKAALKRGLAQVASMLDGGAIGHDGMNG